MSANGWDFGDTDLLSVAEASQLLDIGYARIYVLIKEARLRRVKVGHRAFITRSSAEGYQQEQQTRRDGGSQSWPPTRRDQRAIVETLLLAGVITKADVAQQERARLAAAVRRVTHENAPPASEAPHQ